jgi:hypothetical protein
MSELIDSLAARASIRRQLLATASAFALTAYIASTNVVRAEETDRPTIWIELGGQMEQVQGTTGAFIAPFMTAISPVPDVYANDIFNANQKPAKLSFGAQGSLSFQPESSDWIFSASLKFGRSQTHRHAHKQGPFATIHPTWDPTFTHFFPAGPFADEKGSEDESHAILDFKAGRDVGLGAFGRNGTSVISVGVRMAQFSSKANVNAMGRPQINLVPAHGFGGKEITFYNYTMIAHAERSFRGVGPSLSWDASAALLGNKNDGELTVDWGVNGAVLFGRQKAKTSHATQAYHLPTAYYSWYAVYYYAKAYTHPHHVTRSRSVVVPNLGGFAGVSVKYPNVKVSLGYRADFFFGAMDTGIDTAKRTTTGFFGPFATVSIGIGG